MGIFKKKNEHIFVKPSDATIAQCFKKGDIITKLSFFILGLGNLLNRQFARGIVFLAAEIAYITYMLNTGIAAIGDMGVGSEAHNATANSIIIFVVNTGNASFIDTFRERTKRKAILDISHDSANEICSAHVSAVFAVCHIGLMISNNTANINLTGNGTPVHTVCKSAVRRSRNTTYIIVTVNRAFVTTVS